jgi:hypothetical protein
MADEAIPTRHQAESSFESGIQVCLSEYRRGAAARSYKREKR